ncbi:Hypothetical predicted protein [Pelobates cultripes]|uniref:Uncharacterized protein n=1 Tax=Pelobates cultripes TaxID=61616 RepID=A0AAD1T0V8_PELCU|nr:Hypothetical predicted protein [Pelobates cultripes]
MSRNPYIENGVLAEYFSGSNQPKMAGVVATVKIQTPTSLASWTGPLPAFGRNCWLSAEPLVAAEHLGLPLQN